MSFRPLSLHSQTTGLTLPVVSQISGFRSSIYFTSAVSTVPTLRVLVKRMGVSSVPSSSIWTRPVVLPKPLMTWLAAITLSWKISPGWGSRAVTPVWTSPSDSVQWPTVTPGTSLILSSGPQGSLPTRMPRFFHSDSIPIQILLTKMPSSFRAERAFFVYSSPCSTRLMAPKS